MSLSCEFCFLWDTDLPRPGHSSATVLQSVTCLRATVEPDNEEVLAHYGLLLHENNVENITDLYVFFIILSLTFDTIREIYKPTVPLVT